MFNEKIPTQPIKQESYHEVMEDGLQAMRKRGGEKKDGYLKYKREVENRPMQIKEAYSVDASRQKFPGEEVHYTGQFIDLSQEKNSFTPVRVETGQMVTANNDREFFTDALSGCVACFIEGKDTKSLIHMASGNETYNYGFWQEEGFDYDPAPATVERIMQNIGGLERVEDLKICILSNHKRTYGKQQLQKLKAIFEENGIESIRIEEMPLDSTLVYHSPVAQDYLLAIGRYYDGKQLYAKSLNIPLSGDDSFIEIDTV